MSNNRPLLRQFIYWLKAKGIVLTHSDSNLVMTEKGIDYFIDDFIDEKGN